MTKANGVKTVTIILSVIGLVITAAVVVSSVGTDHGKKAAAVQFNTEAIHEHTVAIKENTREIRVNSDHRIADAKDSEFFVERFDRIEETIDDFTKEQKSVNREILNRLPKQ